jgi:hypothetical protein
MEDIQGRSRPPPSFTLQQITFNPYLRHVILTQGVTKGCRLSLLTNSALVWAQMRGGGGLRGLSQWVNFGDLTPYLGVGGGSFGHRHFHGRWWQWPLVGVICTAMVGPYRLPCRTVPVALTAAAQLQADGISGCCYIVNVHNTQPSVMNAVTKGRQGPALYVNSSLVLAIIGLLCQTRNT